MEDIVREQIIKLLEYLYMNKKIEKSDGILGLGSIDIKVAKKCAELYRNGYGKYIIFTGNCGKGTRGIITKTEAEIFRDIAVSEGVPKEKVYLEKKATDTYGNYLYSNLIIKENNLKANSLIVVQKPYAERRSFAISQKFYKNRKVYITSPNFNIQEWEEYYFDNKNTNLIEIANEIVAEICVNKKMPKYNLQIEQEIPQDIINIYNNLVDSGFNKYLITDEIIKNKLKELEHMI